MTHRHTVGDGPVGTKGKTEIHSRAKQAYIFWGLVPLGRPQPAVPSHGNYQIKTGSNVGDAFLGVLTFGIVSFRTIRIVVHKEQKVFEEGYQKGGKISIQKGKESFVGEIIELDTDKGRVRFQYLNIYGETETEERSVGDVATLTDEQYTNRLSAWKAEIEKYKYNIGEYATWVQQKETKFGVILELNDKSHKATIESLDIYGDKKTKDEPYLDVTIIDATQYAKLLEDWNKEVAKYKFEVGEKVSFNQNGATVQAEIISVNAETHQAEIKYTNEKSEEKTIKKSVLDLKKG